MLKYEIERLWLDQDNLGHVEKTKDREKKGGRKAFEKDSLWFFRSDKHTNSQVG